MHLKYIVFRDKEWGWGVGILSAVLYNSNIIDLICSLRDTDYSCEIGSEYFGVINYVDEIVLISGSLVKMQFTLDICLNYGCQCDIVFNGTKSQFICCGRGWNKETAKLLPGTGITSWYYYYF